MKTYLLPCDCSREIPVTAADAGGSVPCPQCGRQVDVPKLRNLGSLRQVVAGDAPVARRWTAGHSTVLVGLLLAATTGMLSMLFPAPPAPQVDLDDLRRTLAATPYANIYGIWVTEMRQRQIAPKPTPAEEAYRQKAAESRAWRQRLQYAAGASLALAATGALAVALRSAAERSRGAGS